MRDATGPRSRWRDLILQVATTFRSAVEPDEVAARALLYHSDAIDAEMQVYVQKLGLNALTRQIVKHELSDDDDDGRDQFELFAPNEREIARQLGLKRLYVPSRGKFVLIHDPQQITTTELREAAGYLRSHSAAVARHAELVEQLADMREAVT